MKKQDWMPEGILKQIELREFALKQAKLHIIDLQHDVDSWVDKLSEQARHVLQTHFPGRVFWFSLKDGWPCPTSPIGVCLDDLEESDECCVVCGEPLDERK